MPAAIATRGFRQRRPILGFRPEPNLYRFETGFESRMDKSEGLR
jgi:hypothetical protein